MAKQVTLGGDRLGSGSKQKVELKGFERSTHDLGYLWRSTMSSGTLVPFMSELALPGDTFDINLGCEILTHPTIGPLFGSYKVQLDVFQAPIRLYQGQLHNNKLGIGMNMANVKLPFLDLRAKAGNTDIVDPDNVQINPSHIFSYFGIRGVGAPNDMTEATFQSRRFNAIPLLAYWDVYKQYYSNKMEDVGYVIHKAVPGGNEAITGITVGGTNLPTGSSTIITASQGAQVIVTFTTGQPPQPENVIFNTDRGPMTLRQLIGSYAETSTTFTGNVLTQWTGMRLFNWVYGTTGVIVPTSPQLQVFQLSSIDDMREKILQDTASYSGTAFDVFDVDIEPWSFLYWDGTGTSPYLNNQEGLAIKTYQSDLFNNWLKTDWIDGVGGITEVTAIDTSGGSFTIDTLNLSKKVYDMLNRIAVSGGTYDDWLDAVYDHDRIQRAESPIYHGGLIKELAFQEVISNSASQSTTQGAQPLGTLAGRGKMTPKHKGGQITIKIDEPSYIIGIVSLTPRIDYSQGNKWDVHLATMDDFHKPNLDEIGFQELITEQMAWFSTYWDQASASWKTRSAGKQPAWINYMTNVNQTRGNFAIKSNEMFMTLNRRYEGKGPGNNVNEIADLTTYIDPVKFNQIFAESAIDSQNFWTQIAVDITARRKMSAKIMPNL